MLFPLKSWALIIIIVLQINGVLAVLCYRCNTRDNEGCDNIRFGNRTLTETCGVNFGVPVCSIIKGQWGYNKKPEIMLWRGCFVAQFCSQETSVCCHCDWDYCNYDSDCPSKGNILVPGYVHFLLNSVFLGILYWYLNRNI